MLIRIFTNRRQFGQRGRLPGKVFGGGEGKVTVGGVRVVGRYVTISLRVAGEGKCVGEGERAKGVQDPYAPSWVTI